MSNFKVGIMLDSLRLGFERGIDKAAEIGADRYAADAMETVRYAEEIGKSL